MKTSVLLTFVIFVFTTCNIQKSNTRNVNDDTLLKTEEIRIRDPFIYADSLTGTYYLYASKSNRTDKEGLGVEVYTSKDLQNWTQPKTVFQVPDTFWAKKWVWAPEVHKYKGKYYLFVTFTSNKLMDNPPAKKPEKDWPPYYKRGTQILVADSPEGIFRPFANKPATPENHMCLDGTLWVENDTPYLIYCHEWVEIQDGTIEIMPLKNDLSSSIGISSQLFKASDAAWVRPIADGKGYITDGCFLNKTKTGKLLMIWSSNGKGGYSIGIAESTSGSIYGPWKQKAQPLFSIDGGHGMIFHTLSGQLTVALHQPNSSPDERMHLYKLKDTGNNLVLEGKLFPEN